MKLNIRNNLLVLLSFLVYLLAISLLSYIVDIKYYTPAKRLIIQNNYFKNRPIYSAQFNRLSTLFVKDLTDRTDTQKERKEEEKPAFFILAYIDQEMKFKDSPLIAFEITSDDKVVLSKERTDVPIAHSFWEGLIDAADEILEILTRTKDRTPRLDTLRNSLLTRDLKFIFSQRLQDPTRPNAPEYEMRFTYTTIPNYPLIEALTARYWRYLGYLFLSVTALYLLLLRFAILPVRNVAAAIQASRGDVPKYIEHPRAGLEWLYNRMARDASLTALRIGLRDPRSRRLRMTLEELVEHLEPRVTEWFGFQKLYLLEMEWTGKEVLHPTRQFPKVAEEKETAWHVISEAFDKSLIRNLRTSWESQTPTLFRCELPGDGGTLFIGGLPIKEPDAKPLVIALKIEKANRRTTAWYKGIAEGLYEQVISLVEKQGADSRELMREKSETNINLSRNMGHDLTNIIATNRLELMTVNRVLKGDPKTWGESPQKAEILKESMARLLDNSRSLQEIVNLYRAYEYLKSPRYETYNLNRLITEILDVFCLSMSVAIDVSRDLAPDLPETQIEPRLLKLAIFNLLNNAQDAIRRLPLSKQSEGKIFVQTLWNRDKNKILVKLSDTGPGIRTPEGKLASDEKIVEIFDLGYTTKVDGGGEGLGLNWVRTILTDFHKGDLQARNRPGGGAEFEFSLDATPKDPK